MDERDLDELRAIALSVGRLLGRLEQEQQSQPPADPPAFLTNGMRFAAQEGAFRLYVKAEGGDAAQSVSNVRTQQEGDEDLKYLSKRKDGRWCGRRTVNGRRVCVYGRTQRECRDKLNEALNLKKKSPKRESLITFARWWIETYKKDNVSKSTYDSYRYAVNTHLNITTPINKVTTVQLQELLNRLPATRTRENVYKTVRQIMKKAYELDLIKKDVSAFLVLGKIEKGERRALNLDEQRALIGALGDDMFARRVMFYLCTGARPSEIATVRKDEIRPGWIKINGTKTAKAVRWVKVSGRLSEMVKSQGADFFTFNNKRFRERLQKFARAAGIEANIDVYTLRHTFATNLYIIGVAEKDRQVYMGHASGSSLTNDVYTTFSPDVKSKDIYDIYGDWYPEF